MIAAMHSLPRIYRTSQDEQVQAVRDPNEGLTISQGASPNLYLGFQQVLDAYDFGLPQKRRRLWIIGFKRGLARGPSATHK